MADPVFYRGGSSVVPKPGEVRIDPTAGLLRTTHGISVYDRPDGLERFGGAFQVTDLPDGLRIIQRGRDPDHHEITPATPMTQQEYEDLLQQIVLVPV